MLSIIYQVEKYNNADNILPQDCVYRELDELFCHRRVCQGGQP